MNYILRYGRHANKLTYWRSEGVTEITLVDLKSSINFIDLFDEDCFGLSTSHVKGWLVLRITYTKLTIFVLLLNIYLGMSQQKSQNYSIVLLSSYV